MLLVITGHHLQRHRVRAGTISRDYFDDKRSRLRKCFAAQSSDEHGIARLEETRFGIFHLLPVDGHDRARGRAIYERYNVELLAVALDGDWLKGLKRGPV